MKNNYVGLLEITGCEDADRKADIVFVHGLGGHPLATWHRDEKTDEDSWLYWLGNDLPHVAVWAYGYEAEFSKLKGKAMPRFDQASNLMEWLENSNLARRPIIFVTHSLGGLLVKELLRNAQTHKNDRFCNSLIEQTKGIVFLATPHTGSHLANLVGIIGKVINTTISVDELKANNPWLRDLDNWYRQSARYLDIKAKVYYETQNTFGYKVVDEDSANPKLEGVRCTAVPTDHISIAKPSNRKELVYRGVTQFIERTLVDLDNSALPPLEKLKRSETTDRNYSSPSLKNNLKLSLKSQPTSSSIESPSLQFLQGRELPQPQDVHDQYESTSLAENSEVPNTESPSLVFLEKRNFPELQNLSKQFLAPLERKGHESTENSPSLSFLRDEGMYFQLE